jgi:hypothetical protein
VLLSSSEDDRVSHAQLGGFLSPRLGADAALDDEEPLGARMDMPVGASAGIERHTVDVHGVPVVGRRQELGDRRSYERVGVDRARRGVGVTKDSHGRLTERQGGLYVTMAV